MSNTPGQDSSPRTIDAKALQDQLIEFMLETALRQKRFQNLIGLMEQVTAEARATKGDDWQGALEQLKKDLAASHARLFREVSQARPTPPVTGSLPPELQDIRNKLSRLENQMAALLKALSGGPAGLTLTQVAAEELTRQGSLSSNPSRPRGGRTFWPAWMRSPLISLLSLLVAAAAVAALVMNAGHPEQAPATALGTLQPAPAAPTPAADEEAGVSHSESAPHAEATESEHAASAWDMAWSRALVQPAICSTDAKKTHVPFVRCACPELAPSASLAPDGGAGTPVAGLESQCSLDEKDPKWNNRLAVAALQAILMSAPRLNGKVKGNVEGNAPRWADGGVGDHTITAIKVLGTCQSLAQSDARALGVLESKVSGPDERGTAALKLLATLKADPSCLNADTPNTPAGTAAHPLPRHP